MLEVTRRSLLQDELVAILARNIDERVDDSLCGPVLVWLSLQVEAV